MSRESEFVERLKQAIQPAIRPPLQIKTGHRLAYAVLVDGYSGSFPEGARQPVTSTHGYQTDLLIAEESADAASWLPRLVIEFKLGRVSTHDALTYSAKAATHKRSHPYLRYGIIIGGYDGPVPRRLIRHGDHFDFMATLPSEELTRQDRSWLVGLITQEVKASQTIGALLAGASKIRLIHRRLEASM